MNGKKIKQANLPGRVPHIANMPRTGVTAMPFSQKIVSLMLLIAGVSLALTVRYLLLPIETNDYKYFLGPWYDFIVQNGHFAALKHSFSDYNVPYLYLMTTVSMLLPGVHKLFAIKMISITFDFVLAFLVYLCVRLKYPKGIVPVLAALATLLAPTVLINSAMWGQCDSIYTTFLVACLYCLLSGRQAWAFIAFGLAFSFKLQAVFLGPFLLWLLARQAVNWYHFLLIPMVYIVSALPAWLIGRPFAELCLVYFDQVGQHNILSMSSPNLYQWISNDYYNYYPVGIAFTAGVALAIAAFLYQRRVPITAERMVFLATFSVLVMPYILPKMHERYFFPADVIAIILAFYCPRYWYVPVVVGLVSLSSYSSSFGKIIIPLPWLAVVLLVLIAVLARKCLLIFRARSP